jgi:hypothetical protein
MATFDESKQELESSDSYSRLKAVRALAQMANQRDRVVPLLKERLAVDDDSDIIEAIVEALAQMNALDDNVFGVLKDRISDSNSLVRHKVIRGLVKFQRRAREVVSLLKERLKTDESTYVLEEAVDVLKKLHALNSDEVISLLRRRLETDENPYVIRQMIIGLHQAGMTVEQMSRILARNPHFPKWSHREWHDLWNSSVVRQVAEHTLRQRWWRLPADFRRSFGPPWFLGEPWRHHCPQCEIMWHDFIRLLERGGGRRQEAEWLIASMGRWWGSPRWHFARHDFEQLMSMRVEQNVIYEEQNVLRFRYMDAFATDRQGRPISEQAPQDWGELLSTEAEFDRVRAEIADLKRQQEDIIREAERQREGRALEPGEPLPQNLQGRWNEIAERLRRLEGDVEPGEFQRLSRPLEEATEKLLPHLRQRGVRFTFVEIEGVLGEYNFYERKVTLYPPMIELAADELSTQLHRSRQEVYDDLYTITEMHETAHAMAHLGIDSNNRLWEKPQQSTSELHETIAQFYTLKLIERMNDSKLKDVFLKLNEKQPARYTFWRYMEGIPLERVRVWLRLEREGHWEDDILAYAREIAEVVNRSQPLIEACMSDTQQRAFYKGLADIRQRMERAEKLTELCETADALITHCEAYPLVWNIVQSTVGRRLTPLPKPMPGVTRIPQRWERGLLIAAALCKDGKRVRGPMLRLSIDEIEGSAVMSLTASQIDLRNEVIRELSQRAVLEQLAASGPPSAKSLAEEVKRDPERFISLLEEMVKTLKEVK